KIEDLILGIPYGNVQVMLKHLPIMPISGTKFPSTVSDLPRIKIGQIRTIDPRYRRWNKNVRGNLVKIIKGHAERPIEKIHIGPNIQGSGLFPCQIRVCIIITGPAYTAIIIPVSVLKGKISSLVLIV